MKTGKAKKKAKAPQAKGAEGGCAAAPGSVARRLWTMSNLLDQIPVEWRDVPVCIGDSIGRATRVKRVTLHSNRNGSRVIVIHETEIQPLIENA